MAALALLVPLSVPIPAARAADPPDAQRGRLLYENHCQSCHTSKVHGRNPPLAIDRGALRRIVGDWARQAGLGWEAGEIEDVVQYLEVTHYRRIAR